MAASDPSNSILEDPYQRQPARRMSGLKTSKLRDSCHACALSKVKCSKEKPICTRCARRNVACEYFVTKRPGRKRDKPQPTNSNTNHDTVNAYATLSENNSSLTPLDHNLPTPRPNNVFGDDRSSSDTFSSLFMPLEPSLSSFDLEAPNSEFDDRLASPLDFLELGPDDITQLLLPKDTNPGTILEASPIDGVNISKPSSLSSNGPVFSSSGTTGSVPPDSSSCCLVQALDLMKKLSLTKPPISVLPRGSDGVMDTSDIYLNKIPSAQGIVVENKQSIETVSKMLRCSCAQDSYLLTILSMIVFKMLGRYAAAAREQQREVSEEGHEPSGSGPKKGQVRLISDYYLSSKSIERMAAQSILSELHQVQRLMNQLSPRLKAPGSSLVNTGVENSGGRSSRADCQAPFSAGEESKAAPFSTGTLDQIEVDLRKSLSTLSSEIINVLRQS
ncbi:MAG: hypothetical protein M1822_007151 [Bathelium mastoideum]|nr:MAG: hypothetical protein M1822_007151 [Bathelium mastoideum]